MIRSNVVAFPRRLCAARNQSLIWLLFMVIILAGRVNGAEAAPGSVNVRDFGAVGDGKAVDTEAIQKALNNVADKGGGEVRIPAGNYLTGSLVMRSHTTLRLENGAIVLGSPKRDDYPLIQARWEGREVQCHRALISADHAEKIAIVGEGTIEGNAQVSRLRDPRGPAVVEMIECSDVRMEGITLKSTRIWTLHPTYCRDVTISKVKFETSGANGDGIDPDSCQRIVIDGCTFSTDDDNIAIKSGKGQEGVKIGRPCEDISITNCTFLKGWAAICFGSELSGGIRKVRISNCTFKQGKAALFLKLRPARGGYVQDISADNLVVETTALLVTDTNFSHLVDPQGVPGQEGQTQFSNIRISNVQINSKRLVDVKGMADMPLDGLEIKGVKGTCKEGSLIQNAKNVVFKDIILDGISGPAYSIDNVEGTGLDGTVHVKKR